MKPDQIEPGSSRWPLGGISLRQWLIGMACVGAVGWAGFRLQNHRRSGLVRYPYWCRQCRAVYDVSELKKDLANTWRVPPGAPSESVVLCLRCKQGWAYPAATCYQCGAVHVMHLWPDSNCPKCDPAIARTAAASGIDLMPRELQR